MVDHDGSFELDSSKGQAAEEALTPDPTLGTFLIWKRCRWAGVCLGGSDVARLFSSWSLLKGSASATL